MPTAEQVFESSVHALPRSERLRLAALILQELAQADPGALDYADTWSDEDVSDIQVHSLRHAVSDFPQDDDLV
jgi:hypothetical protein